jgi:hypothetical protein
MTVLMNFDYSDLVVSYEQAKINRTRASRIAEDVRDECFLCARPVNRTKTAWVELCNLGGLLPVSLGEKPEWEGGTSQGYFPVGSECIKQIPKEYVTKKLNQGINLIRTGQSA